MQTFGATLLTIGLQLTLGALVLVGAGAFFPRDPLGPGPELRRRVATRARAAAEMLRALPIAAGSGLCGGALLVLFGEEPRRLVTDTGFVVFVAVGAFPTCAAYLLHDAARLEASGRLRVARRQIRFAGLRMCWGVGALLVCGVTSLLLLPGQRRALLEGPPLASMILAAGALSLAGAGFIALLAGLSGKPRPSGEIAVWLYLCGLAGILGASGLH